MDKASLILIFPHRFQKFIIRGTPNIYSLNISSAGPYCLAEVLSLAMLIRSNQDSNLDFHMTERNSSINVLKVIVKGDFSMTMKTPQC